LRPPAPDGPPPVNWGDPAVLSEMLGRYGDVQVDQHELLHHDATPEEAFDRWERLHPMWIGARQELAPAGEWEPLREASIAALREGGIGTGATSTYLLAVLDRR